MRWSLRIARSYRANRSRRVERAPHRHRPTGSSDAAHAERGIARYSIELTRALLRLGAPVGAIVLNPFLGEPRGLPDDIVDSPLLTRRTARTFDADPDGVPVAYHLMSPIELELPPLRTIAESALQRCDALVAVLYDLIPLVFQERYLQDPRVREPYLARLDLLRKRTCCSPSRSHAARRHRAARRRTGRVVTIGGGVSDDFACATVLGSARRCAVACRSTGRSSSPLRVGSGARTPRSSSAPSARSMLRSRRRATRRGVHRATRGEAAWRAEPRAGWRQIS
jgi:hypothetical protein